MNGLNCVLNINDAQVAYVDGMVSKKWEDFIIPILGFAFLILNWTRKLIVRERKATTSFRLLRFCLKHGWVPYFIEANEGLLLFFMEANEWLLLFFLLFILLGQKITHLIIYEWVVSCFYFEKKLKNKWNISLVRYLQFETCKEINLGNFLL